MINHIIHIFYAMPKATDLTNQRFGRLVAVAATDMRASHRVVWRCLCDCGNEAFAQSAHLVDGRRVSCGCAKVAGTQIRKKRPRHGHYVGNVASPTYSTWSGMQTRCFNKTAPAYKHYGARGITVCERWRTFDNFLADMGAKPARCSIDRIDVNGNYEPGNCRWATSKEQSRNKRNTGVVMHRGALVPSVDVSVSLGAERHLVAERLAKGWSHEDATTTPPLTKSQIAARTNKKRWG